LNLCAEENWVVGYLFYGGMVEEREEALEGLRTKWVFYGWSECQVSNSIEEKFWD
jgi:hypothetical protein